MRASDLMATLDQALAAAGLDQMTLPRRPRLLSDNRSYALNNLTTDSRAR